MSSKPEGTMTIDKLVGLADAIIAEVEKAVVGKTAVLRQLLAVLLSRGGHILIEDYPGLAKTLIANSFATALGLEFKRIQFTPDLLPGDITGGYIFDRSQQRIRAAPGPDLHQHPAGR